jgi:hypothetical protein
MSETTGDTSAESGMATGSEAGSPGQRTESLSGRYDETAAAVVDDTPLPPEAAESGNVGAADADDGLSPQFQEPDTDAPDP